MLVYSWKQSEVPGGCMLVASWSGSMGPGRVSFGAVCPSAWSFTFSVALTLQGL